MIDSLCSESQYLSHVLPIWKLLPDHLRGNLHVSSRLAELCRTQGVKAVQSPLPRHGGPVLVASSPDYRQAHNRPIIFVEHGAGQAYKNAEHNQAYSGGQGRDRVILFVCPSNRVAERNLTRYPETAFVVAGCPRLDPYHPPTPKPVTDTPTVAFSWHADIRLVPESASAFSIFHVAIPLVVQAGYKVFGHAHPRIYRRLVPFYRKYGVEPVPESDRVLREADVLVVDNSSIGFEFGSLGRPVVWMSPPTYRRDLIQWPRFWDALVLGEHAESPSEVPDAIRRALIPPSPDLAASRDQFISSVYKYRLGDSAQRAVEAIVRVVGA